MVTGILIGLFIACMIGVRIGYKIGRESSKYVMGKQMLDHWTSK